MSTCRTAAQQRVYRIEAQPFMALDEWLAPYRRLWDRETGRLLMTARSRSG